MTLNLPPEEQVWLADYRAALHKDYKDLVEDLVVFGIEPCEDNILDSYVNVFVLLKKGDRQTKEDICNIGYRLASVFNAVPFILVHTQEEWMKRQKTQSLFYQIVTRDGVSLSLI